MEFCDERPRQSWSHWVGWILGATLALYPAGAVAQSEIVLRDGDFVADGSVIPNGSSVIVDGGTIGLGVDLADGFLSIRSGEVAFGASSVAQGFSNFSNIVRLSGGDVGGFFQLSLGTQFTMTGGTIESFGVFNGSHAEIMGGVVSRFPDIFSGGSVDIFGGDIFAVRVFQGGTVHFFGNDFALDGVPISGIGPGESRIITDRDVTLTGVLEDGFPIETDLSSSPGGFFGPNPDAATVGSTVIVTNVPEPAVPLGLTQGWGLLIGLGGIRNHEGCALRR